MKVVVKAKEIRDDKLGLLRKDRVVDMPEQKAHFFLARGDVIRYETKVLQENPYKAAGMEQQPSVSPVAQASPMQTSSESESGGKRRGRKPKSLS